MNPIGLVQIVLGLVLAPLLFGVINRVKAGFAGRRGPPLLQLYFDLFRLLRKGAVYSRTTSWVFRAGPMVGLAAVVASLALLPCGPLPSLIAFPGDFVLFACLLGLARFATVAAALDTGSAFEGMGASREAFFATLSEPTMLLGFTALTKLSGALSLTGMFGHIGTASWAAEAPAMVLVVFVFFILLLAENARIPVDDPNTHLELTMIHEVMVLDHSGPDFAFIEYGASLKLWAFGLVLAGMAPPYGACPVAGAVIGATAVFAAAVAVGVVEATMARLRLTRVPQLLMAAGAFAFLALVLVFR